MAGRTDGQETARYREELNGLKDRYFALLDEVQNETAGDVMDAPEAVGLRFEAIEEEVRHRAVEYNARTQALRAELLSGIDALDFAGLDAIYASAATLRDTLAEWKQTLGALKQSAQEISARQRELNQSVGMVLVKERRRRELTDEIARAVAAADKRVLISAYLHNPAFFSECVPDVATLVAVVLIVCSADATPTPMDVRPARSRAVRDRHRPPRVLRPAPRRAARPGGAREPHGARRVLRPLRPDPRRAPDAALRHRLPHRQPAPLRRRAPRRRPRALDAHLSAPRASPAGMNSSPFLADGRAA